MSTKSQQPLFDRGQAYIRSLTSVVDSGFMWEADQLAERDRRTRSESKSDTPQESQGIYDVIIQQMSGKHFESAIHATAAIERALKQLGDVAESVPAVEASKTTIKESYDVLASLDEERIARDMADFIHERAKQWEEGEIKKWLAAFPDEQGQK